MDYIKAGLWAILALILLLIAFTGFGLPVGGVGIYLVIKHLYDNYSGSEIFGGCLSVLIIAILCVACFFTYVFNR